ncbi:MAG: class I SAM-dependent methyltransferase [Candidatus Taylorbacteria bacterium]|nr:class I SAM-dependent methyltransferase [Candidatus Taylorbacteria bacterium]
MSRNTSWGGVAGWYDKVVNDDDSYQAKVILPNVLRIVALEKGKKVLDLACGQGYFSHALAAKGAHVTGVDISSELIEIARTHAGHNEEFYVSSAESLPAFKEKGFDVAICVLAIQNIDRMAQAFREVSRVLKDKGRFVLVLNHPAFRIPEESSWGWDEKDGVQYRRVDGYMSESRSAIDMHPGKTEKKDLTYSFHRPLQAYSKSLANAGFSIARIEEWVSHKESEKGPKKQAEDRARKEIPLFMCLECSKV